MSSNCIPTNSPQQEENTYYSDIGTEEHYGEERRLKYIEHLFHPDRYGYTKQEIEVIRNERHEAPWRVQEATRLGEIIEQIANLYETKLAENNGLDNQRAIPSSLLGGDYFTNWNVISKSSLDLTVEFVKRAFTFHRRTASQELRDFIAHLNEI